MLEKKIPIINEDYKTEKFDNEVLLYTISGTKVISLNETAYLVYQLCNGEQTIDEMIDMLIDAYPDQKEEIREHIISAINTMIDNGVIRLSDG